MGGILSGPEIVRLVEQTQAHKALRSKLADLKVDWAAPVPSIEIEPFNPDRCGPNSYDVLLSDQIRVYRIASARRAHPELFDGDRSVLPDGVDMRNPPPTLLTAIPADGMWLYPGVLYLGATVESTLCHGLVPWLDGRSSVGRLGLSIHVTAGRGDDGWKGVWTCEITAVAHPVKVYPNERFGQLTFFTLVGQRKEYAGHYQNQAGPTESRMHLNLGPKGENPQ
jgi:dCTP deaminase